MAINNLEMKSNLIARIVVEKDGRARPKLDYYGSPMNHPKYRMSRFIRRYTTKFVDEGYRHSPDLFATDTLGDPNLFWCILRFNAILNPLDPVNGFVPGRTLKVPNIQELKKWLQAVNANQLDAIENGARNKSTLVTI